MTLLTVFKALEDPHEMLLNVSHMVLLFKQIFRRVMGVLNFSVWRRYPNVNTSYFATTVTSR